jgi:hypothetical protein
MVSITSQSLPAFDPATTEWTIYEQQVVNLLEANGIDDPDRRRAALLTVIGTTALKTLISLVAPDRPATQTFDQLLVVLRNHYGEQQRTTESTARLQFTRCRQTDGQTVEDFVAELRRIAIDCAFGNELDGRLRDQLIAGVRNDSTRKEMLKLRAPNRTFAASYTAARDSEKLQADLKKYSTSAGSSTTAHVHAVQSRQPQPHNRAGPPRGSPRGPSVLAGSQRGSLVRNPLVRSPSVRGPSASNPATNPKCDRCGASDHPANTCFYRDKDCFACGKHGHKASVCRSKPSHSGTTGARSNKSKTSVKHTAVRSTGPCADSPAEEEDIDGAYTVKTLHVSAPQSTVVRIPVKIEGHSVQTEYDSGSYYSIFNRSLWSKLGKPALVDAPILYGIEHRSLSMLGQCDLSVTYDGLTKTLTCVFLNSDTQLALFGRAWALAFGLPLGGPVRPSLADSKIAQIVSVRTRHICTSDLKHSFV